MRPPEAHLDKPQPNLDLHRALKLEVKLTSNLEAEIDRLAITAARHIAQKFLSMTDKEVCRAVQISGFPGENEINHPHTEVGFAAQKMSTLLSHKILKLLAEKGIKAEMGNVQAEYFEQDAELIIQQEIENDRSSMDYNWDTGGTTASFQKSTWIYEVKHIPKKSSEATYEVKHIPKKSSEGIIGFIRDRFRGSLPHH